MRKIRLLVVAATTGAALIIPAVPSTAAPINCPGQQVATKVAGGWDCVNPGGNTSNAEDPKNPNKGKGDF